jgi:hypothetical protein
MKSMRRVLRYDGLIPAKMSPDSSFAEIRPENIREIREFIDKNRKSRIPFDIGQEGQTPVGNRKKGIQMARPWEDTRRHDGSSHDGQRLPRPSRASGRGHLGIPDS